MRRTGDGVDAFWAVAPYFQRLAFLNFSRVTWYGQGFDRFLPAARVCVSSFFPCTTPHLSFGENHVHVLPPPLVPLYVPTYHALPRRLSAQMKCTGS